LKKLFVFYFLSIFIWAEQNVTNALVNETSPYLQQHVHNPVNWYPWGEEAFEKAKKENKLIFLSIGYSTCHWCHVMEEESFTDETIAKLLNDSFVSIKVDKEEYPQLDKKYQKFYMDVHGKRGGWPLSIFLSPLGEVFHLATYIPPDSGYGSLGMMNILSSFATFQESNTTQIERRVSVYQDAVHKNSKSKNMSEKLNVKVMDTTVNAMAKIFDKKHGGFDFRPKFPEASRLALLLDIYKLNGNKEALHMAEYTLKQMAKSGLYDQIGGGFFRYTPDKEWQTPHFEKMLYTNAELVSVYVTLYEMIKNPLYKKVVDETIAQMEKNFMKEGVYLSASDADSDGEEGGYFIYAYVEVKKDLLTLGLTLAEVEEVLAYLSIEEDGNIDGDFSHTHITSDIIPPKLEMVKTYLSEVSAKRTFPFVDEKIITAWNAMMIKALFRASRIDKNYLALAKERLNALLKLMYRNNILYHQTLLGKNPKQKALLEDYAFLMDALIEGYLQTYDKQYLQHLEVLAKESIEKFYRNKVWYLSNDGIQAEANFDDRYYTSELSLMLENLVRLSSLREELDYNEIVKETMRNSGAILKKSPEKASKLVHTFLRLKMGDVIVKARREKLQKSKKQIEAMKYPFVLSKPEESDKYLACRVNSCFAYDANLTALIDKINKVVKP